MENLFNTTDRDAMLTRLAVLHAGHARRWGRMTPAQMLAHCTAAFAYPLGQKVARRPLVARVVAPFVKRSVLGPKPLGRNDPTAPDLIIADPGEFDQERQLLHDQILQFCAAGRGGVNNRAHVFFGPLTGDEWGRLMFKHLDHHLRQFGG